MSEAIRLYDATGARLYLTQSERQTFIEAAKSVSRPERTFCTFLHDTGCRISEALEVTGRRIDMQDKAAILRTLKKRRTDAYRAVPLSDATLDLLDMVHGLREAHSGRRTDILDAPLWPLSRVTAWRIVKKVMDAAGIEEGPHRSPKGLRHGFGIHAIVSGVPVTALQSWMGHSKLETTSIYLNAIGQEQRELAARMWS